MLSEMIGMRFASEAQELNMLHFAQISQQATSLEGMQKVREVARLAAKSGDREDRDCST